MAAVTLTHLAFTSTDPTHFVHIVSNLLSESECAEIISSHHNLVESNLTLGTIRVREQFDDQALVDLLWSRISHIYADDRIKDEEGYWWKAKGLNPHLRLSKYEKQGRFTAHFDYRRLLNVDEMTFMSVNIYLNTVAPENKGCTRILKHDARKGNYWNGRDELEAIAKIQPVMGSASIFRDTLWHDGEELLGGEKYLLRTDVVYEREEKLDFDKRYWRLGRMAQARKAGEMALMLMEGGNSKEADVWYDKEEELLYGD